MKVDLDRLREYLANLPTGRSRVEPHGPDEYDTWRLISAGAVADRKVLDAGRVQPHSARLPYWAMTWNVDHAKAIDAIINAMPELIAELDRLREENEALEAFHGDQILEAATAERERILGLLWKHVLLNRSQMDTIQEVITTPPHVLSRCQYTTLGHDGGTDSNHYAWHCPRCNEVWAPAFVSTPYGGGPSPCPNATSKETT